MSAHFKLPQIAVQLLLSLVFLDLSNGQGGVQTIVLISGEPKNDTLSAPPPGSGLLGLTQYSIQVPAGATQLKVDLEGNQNVDLYIRFGRRISTNAAGAVADFKSSSSGGSESITISPSSTPALQEGAYFIAIGNFGPGTANFTVTATVAAEVEADVSPRPNGSNNGAVTVADWTQVGRFVAGLDSAASGGEFQRADCAPKETRGNGNLTVTDWVQAGRYAAGLDPVAPVGGPTGLQSSLLNRSEKIAYSLRTLRVLRNHQDEVAIELDASGDENALGFSLKFNPAQLQFVSAALDDDARGAILHINAGESARGRLGVAIALPAGQTFRTGSRQLISIKFKTKGKAASINFGDQPVMREASDVRGRLLQTTYTSRAPISQFMVRKEQSPSNLR